MTTCYDLYGYAPDWDTGICTECKLPLDDEQREQAVHGTVRFGWNQYMHPWCFDKAHPVFITAAQVREKWYALHPEIFD